MPWLSRKLAAERLNTSPATVGNHAYEGRIIRREGLYWVPDEGEPKNPDDVLGEPDAPAPSSASSAAAPAKPLVESVAGLMDQKALKGEGAATKPPRGLTAWTEVGVRPEDLEHDYETGGGRYEYVPKGVPNGDRYIFALRARPGRPFVLAGDTVRSMVLAYSNDGSKATLNELSRTFHMHRAVIREIIRVLGKTHDSAPFTDEDIAERGEDALVEDQVRLKEEKVILRAEKRVWDETKRYADRARNFDKFVAERLEQIIRTEGIPSLALPPKRPRVVRVSPLEGGPAVRPFSVVATPSDLHFGKAGWKDETGQEYNRDICTTRLLATADAMIERVRRVGIPAKWILGAGSDWFHIDRDDKGGTTTKGTPQDTDGTWARIFLEGSELAAAYVERLREVAPVHIVCMAGNHDRLGSLMLTMWLAERYRGAGDVVVDRSPGARHYLEIGSTLVGITHGDSCKDGKLPGLMANEAREAWGRTAHRLWFTGHWHSAITNEIHGVRVIHMPSLSGSDRWHSENGFVGNRKALSAYLIDHDEGLIADMPVSARVA